MFDVHLDLSLESIVVFETFLKFKINQDAIVIVEAKKLVLALLVSFQITLKCNGITAVCDVRRSTINTVTVLGGHE